MRMPSSKTMLVADRANANVLDAEAPFLNRDWATVTAPNVHAVAGHARPTACPTHCPGCGGLGARAHPLLPSGCDRKRTSPHGITVATGDVAQLRGDIAGAGPLAPVVFVVVYAVPTLAPLPKNVFSATAGVAVRSGRWVASG